MTRSLTSSAGVARGRKIERVLRDYYAGHLGEADLEDRLLHNVDEGRFRAICQNALEGLASKRLNLEMLIERRAEAQEHHVIPETISRLPGSDAAGFSSLALKAVSSLPHTSIRCRTPTVLKTYVAKPGLAAAIAPGEVSPAIHAPRDGGQEQPRIGHARSPAVRGGPPARP